MTQEWTEVRTVHPPAASTRFPTTMRLHARRTIRIFHFPTEAKVPGRFRIQVTAGRTRPAVPRLLSPLLYASQMLRLATLTAAPDFPFPPNDLHADHALQLALAELFGEQTVLDGGQWLGFGRGLGLVPARPLRFGGFPYVCRWVVGSRRRRRDKFSRS